LDYAMLAERFRGPEDYVRECQRSYVPLFEKRKAVLDIGCGRGEFLELMKEAGVPARGIDISPELVAACRAKGLEAEAADAFTFLPALQDESLDGIFCAHLVEHLEPAWLPELIRLAAAKLCRGGLIAIETPNPECLATLASHFYLDPTHQRPVPSALLRFYLEEAGFGRIEVRRLSPAVESMPSLEELPEGFRAAFFDGLDYAILGRKL
ncbi:MAG: methyltransferase domain-containing protein, partial [Bryobacteraceae bacterium]